MIALTNDLCLRLSLPAGTNAAGLLEYLRGAGQDLFGTLLASDASKAAAEVALVDLELYQPRIVAQAGDSQEKYCTLTLNGMARPVLVGLLAKEPGDSLPTDLESLLFWALIHPDSSWHVSLLEGEAGLPIDWRRVASGFAVIAEPAETSEWARSLVAGLFGLEHPGVSSNQKSLPILSTTSAISINPPADGFSAAQARLMFEAASTTHPKWRCLSLYRILENAYLANIKSALLAEFDLDATKAIESAKKKVASEANQLVHLAESANLTPEFSAFNVKFEALMATGNQYLIKLDKGAESEELYRSPDTYKKAILRFYKIRCSIAHAGTSSVIYEQFSDSNDGINQLLPFIETIAMKSLRISAIT